MFTRPRYEFKYVANMDTINALYQRLKDVMYDDPRAEGGGYHVNSIYYDTSDMLAYFEKIDGVGKRFKIRVRWYGEIFADTDLSKLNIFVEVKHRNNDMIFKNRVRLPGNFLEELCEDQTHLTKLSQLVNDNQAFEATTIQHLASQKLLLPYCIVSYFRRPLLSRISPKLRVTFDTNLRTLGTQNIYQVSSDNGNHILPPDLGIIEIKFHWAMPLWLLEICREVGLNLRRFSKYAASIETLYPDFAMREIRFQNPY